MSKTFKSYITILSISLCAGIVFNSCNKDLEINADYQAYPVIYGLLNPYDSLQTIRVNKSFLGEADPAGYAKVADSSLFDNVNIDLVMYKEGFEIVRYPLSRMVLDGKDSGLFSYPDQVVYGAVLPRITNDDGSESVKYLHSHEYSGGNLVKKVSYRIEGTADDRTISAEMFPLPEEPTDVFQQRSYRARWATSAKPIAFATSGKLTDGLSLETELPPFTKIAELTMIFNYFDTDKNGVTTNHQITRSMNQFVVSTVSETRTTKTEFFVSSQGFYDMIESQVPDFDFDNLVERKAGIVDFEMVLGDNEYYYYRENTLPSDDLNQLKPQYSNIENGFGIFASRIVINVSDWAIATQDDIISINGLEGMLLDKWSQRALNQGYVESSDGTITELGTASKGFCIDTRVDNDAPIEERCN